MYQSDVLMRQVQQAAQVIAQILMLRQQGQLDEALEVIDKACAEFFDLDAEEITTYTYAGLAGRLDAENEADRELMSILSEMLRHHGELKALREEWPLARHSLQLALRLELDLAAARRSAPALDHDPVDALLAHLDVAALDAELFPRLVRHYARAGRFARAEDLLFFGLEAPTPELIETGRAFFERLQELSDEALASGNFSRREVEEGRRAFLTRSNSS